MLGNMDPVLHLNSIAGNKVFSANQTLLRGKGQDCIALELS